MDRKLRVLSVCRAGVALAALAFAVIAGSGVAVAAESANGFDLSHASLPADKISVGSPRDGIRSVNEPEFADSQAAERWVGAGHPVIGLRVGEVAHAYPVHLLEYHQIVNDEFEGVPIVLSFDPLTGVPRAHKRTLDGKVLEFGVSGLVYQSSFLLFDRETESLWLQWSGQAIAGPLMGKRLTPLRVRQEPYAVWLHRNPASLVLARPLLKQIDYRHSPFSVYWASDNHLPVDEVDPTYHPKELVLGLRIDGKSRAYLGSIMLSAGGRVVDDFAGRKIRVAYDTKSGTFSWDVPEDVEVTDAYWFAWKAFQPNSEIWQASEAPAADSAEASAPP